MTVLRTDRKHKRQGRTCHSEKFGNDDFWKADADF